MYDCKMCGCKKRDTWDAKELTKCLVRIESTDPGAYEGKICGEIERRLQSLPGIRLTKEKVLPGRYNLMAELPGKEKKAPALVFICHMDTVVAGEGWSVPPFDAVEENGRIYGRGACDMKAGLACCLSTFANETLKRMSEGTTSAGTLKLICTVDEEDFMRGAEACICAGWVTEKDWILDAEPTNGQIQVAHKGRLWYEIEVKGRTAHASTPWKGADAIAAMAELIRSIRLDIEAAPEHPDLGKSTVTFGQVFGGYRPYVVPDKCKVWVDLRLVPPLNADKTKKIVEKAAQEAKKAVPGIEVSIQVTGNRPFVEKDDNSVLLASLKKACRYATGKETEVCVFPGYTDTAVIAGMLHNHNCMSYGPGNLECAHQPDEWVAVEDIRRCETVYKKLVEEILK